MIPVSNAWKAVQNNTLLPEMFVEITYDVTEPGLQEEAVVSGSDPESFANTSQITADGRVVSKKYISLDYGAWGLDGTSVCSTGSPTNPGYVTSDVASEVAVYPNTEYPTIRLDFSEVHTEAIPGITVTWSETFTCWAVDFRVTAYGSAGIVSQKTITGNHDIVSKVLMDLVDYSSITIEIMKWSHPWQRARCIDIRLGIRSIYGKKDLMSYEHAQTVDLLSAVLPENRITFGLRNDDGRWNPDALTGSEQYLMEQQEIGVRYGMDINGSIEWIPGGKFWLTEWATPSNGLETNFTARDATCFMNDVYVGINAGTLYDIAESALVQADLPTDYVISETLREYETDLTGSEGSYTISAVLQMVAHAGCCVFYQDRNGVVRIEPKNENYSGYMIEPAISYTHPEYEISKPLKAVSVGYGDQNRVTIPVRLKGEIQTVDNAFILTQEDAIRVGEKTKEVLEKRKVISGEFRADMRLDALDNIIVTSKYASNIISITNVVYSTSGGAFKGTYTGRVTNANLQPNLRYSNEFYVGEV